MSAACLLANANNRVPSATVTASSVLPAARTIYKKPTIRQGNGEVVLTGEYSGAADTEIEIEIRPGAGSGVRVSKPVFSGAGNGVMTQPTAVDGTASQTVTVTLVDLGTETTTASAVVEGAMGLRAKATGSAGNAIRLTVTPTLTRSAQPIGALSVALNKDSQEWTDARHDFGAVALNPDGTLPAHAPRLVFAQDLSQVYRHYKKWDGSQWQYGVSPKVKVDYAAQSEVHTVTGSYAVTVSDGSTTETYPNPITLYDLLSALTASDLVEVVGVIANDAKPNGLAAIEVPLRTAPSVLPPNASDPKRMPALRDVSLNAAAGSETLAITCTANTPIGAELWAVQSKVTGALSTAQTGIPYEEGLVRFTVPVIPRTESPIAGQMAITERRFPREKDDKTGLPAICLDRPRLGAKASSQSLRLVWTARPPQDCDCTSAAVTGGPSTDCLGIDIHDEAATMGALAAGHQSRLIILYDWQEAFITANTLISTHNGMLTTVFQDVDLAKRITALFSGCLDDLFKDTATPTTVALNRWDAEQGTMAAALAQLASMAAEPTTGINARWLPGGSYNGGDDLLPPIEKSNGHKYRLFIGLAEHTNPNNNEVDYYPASTFAPTEDVGTWPTDGGSVKIAGVVSFSFGGNILAKPGSAVIVDLGSYSNADNVTTADPVTLRHSVEAFIERYAAKMDAVRALAGLRPKSDASTEGSGCWQTSDAPYYWQIEGSAYLPVFNNVYYHSSVLDGEGRPISTHEFGFGLRVACEDRLKPGDTLTISIQNVSADYPYKIGDQYLVAVIGSGPVALTGGQTGTDTQIWKVESSAGAFPDYALTALEPAYSHGGIQFTLQRGLLPSALGDQFKFTVTAGGRYRWRKDGGAWSADALIVDSAALTEGLTARFVAGATPDFVEGDVHRFRIGQPHSPFNVKSAHGELWRWSGSTATLTLTWPGDQTISVVGLLRHGLRAPAGVSLTLFDAANTPLYSASPTLTAGPILAVLPAPVSARKLTITLTNAMDQALGWVYAGVPLSTRHSPQISLKRAYHLERSQGTNPRGCYLGAGRGGEIRWENWLGQAELEALLDLVDACKEDGDAPLVLLPHALHPQDAALVRIETDAIQVDDYFDYQPNDAANRRLSLTLPLAAVAA